MGVWVNGDNASEAVKPVCIVPYPFIALGPNQLAVGSLIT